MAVRCDQPEQGWCAFADATGSNSQVAAGSGKSARKIEDEDEDFSGALAQMNPACPSLSHHAG